MSGAGMTFTSSSDVLCCGRVDIAVPPANCQKIWFALRAM